MQTNPNWVVVSLGEDCNAFVGQPETDPMIAELFRALTGADGVTRLRKTMDATWQAYLTKGQQDLGYHCLYIED